MWKGEVTSWCGPPIGCWRKPTQYLLEDGHKDCDNLIVRAVRLPLHLLHILVMDGKLAEREQNLKAYRDRPKLVDHELVRFSYRADESLRLLGQHDHRVSPESFHGQQILLC